MQTVREAAEAVRERTVSPVELTDAVLARVERWEQVVNAFSQLHPEEAIEEARAREEEAARGALRGPLHGVPIAVKDLFDVAGWETSGCSGAYRGHVAEADSEVVARLRSAGAVIVGKTNQHELAAGGTNVVSACGPAHNPWDPARITGGSSGGSGAAVAARVVPLAMGSDTGGSIRIPASFCGVTGLKPTFGRIPLTGVMPLAASMDVAGPLAATAGDAAVAFSVLADEGPRFLTSALEAGRGKRLGVLGGFFTDRVRPEVLDALDGIRQTLEEAGWSTAAADVGEVGDSPDVWNRLAWVEFAADHEHLLRRPDSLYLRTRELLELGARATGVDVVRAEQRRREIRAGFLEALRGVDVLLAPATPFPAPPADSKLVEIPGAAPLPVHSGGPAWLTRVINLTGLPALALPCGFTRDGLPLGVQMIGRDGDEGTLLRAGVAIQEATDHHLRVPEPP
jgi:aspartyl-tRNA(Asn)/glutamyl-tRNA(Gln) amidotransferase subunit A